MAQEAEPSQAEPASSTVAANAQPSGEPSPQSQQRQPLDWMQDCLQWGTRAQPDAHGLTMRAINVGLYGEIPEQWHEMSRMPRGAFPVPGVPRLELYAISHKAELWADNATDLYEEAIQRRWAAHVDIPWETSIPLPEDVELGMCQLSTELGQQASIEGEVLSHWLHRMSYGYHEVKNFLATEVFDAARHFEAFRLRAVANGGALGLESPGLINRRLLESRAGWTETALYLYILRGSLTLLLYRYGEAYAHNATDQMLFRRCLQDKARHLAYGMAHLRYAIQHKGPDYILGLQRVLIGVEYDLATEMRDPVLWEALAIICGSGIQHLPAGMAIVKHLQQQYLEDYLRRLQWLGVAKTVQDLAPELQAYILTVAQ